MNNNILNNNILDNTNFFSNTNPDLIGAKTFSDLNKLVIVENGPIKENKTLIISSLNLYKKYVQPNIIPIIIIVLFITFMIYRYMTSKKEDEKKHKKKSSRRKNNINYDVIQQIHDNIQTNNETNIETNNENIQINQPNSLDTLNTMAVNTNTTIEPSIDNVIDSIIQKNDDILDDDEIYELMTEKNEDANEFQDNNYINFVSKTDKTPLDQANKKIFS
jgi:hypothetical protein